MDCEVLFPKVSRRGAVMLQDKLAVGDYVLQVLVTDTVAKKTATQIFPFEIIK